MNRRILWALASLPSFLTLPGWTQSTEEVFGPIQLLSVIEVRKDPRLDHPRGAILCDPENAGHELFFLAGRWYRTLLDQPECGCDFDFDGLSGCQEILLGTFPGINDSDGDCLTDGLEIALGLDPLNPDTDGDGTPDGDEDTNENGVINREDDFDQDGLTNCQEAMLGTNPMNRDTDGDGFHDGAEVDILTGQLISDPRDPNDRPPDFVASRPPVQAILTVSSGADAGGLTYNTFVSKPPASAVLASSQTSTGGISLNTFVTKPPASVIAPSSEVDPGGLGLNTFVSKPPASVIVPSSDVGPGGLGLNTFVSKPPASAIVPSSDVDAGGLSLNTFASDPPVVVEIETD